MERVVADKADITDDSDVRPANWTGPTLVRRGLMAIIIVMLGINLHRLFITNINWDEFFYLSFVYLYQSGTLTTQLQTLHVHLFGWLPLLTGKEIHQVFAGRVFLWFLNFVSCWLIYGISRKFCSREAALFPVLFYLGFSYVVDHGLSFRTDPLCAFLFLASLYLLLNADKTRLHVPLSAFLLAVAHMVSIKSVFYLGTIAPILLTPFFIESDRRAALRSMLIFAATFIVSVTVLYQLHSYALSGAVPNENSTDVATFVTSAGTATVFTGTFLPRLYFVLRGVMENGVIWIFIFLGLVKVGFDVARGHDRKNALFLLSFSLPLLSLLFYRNAFPYFFVFLMPAVMVLGGVFVDALNAYFRKIAPRISFCVLVATIATISASYLSNYISKLSDETIAQKEIVTLVHRMYPEPVPYIDRNSMIASFPKVGIFMSSWGVQAYRKANRAIMDDLIRRKQPRFLIANSCGLQISRQGNDPETPCIYHLFDDDMKTMRANFLHHWGPIYVIGKSFDLRPDEKPELFEILVSGTYTVVAESAVRLNGVLRRPGDHVLLEQGHHIIAATGEATRAAIRLGTNLFKPSNAPSAQPIYQGF